MALDHYISQVYLRNFCMLDPANHLFAVRKSDLLEFTPPPDTVCRIEQGNTNPYLKEPRAIEEFLKTVEPHYNSALDKIRTNNIDRKAIYVISGLAAYFMTCSPGSTRASIPFLRTSVESLGKLLDEKGMLPPPPEVLGGRSLTDLIEDEKIKIEIDGKYPQSFGISNILRCVQTLGNFHWEILENDLSFSPFLTSDYPVSLHETGDDRVIDRLFPLAPDIAVRFRADFKVRGIIDEKFAFPHFAMRRVKCSKKRVRSVNLKTVKSAENLVFSNVRAAWLKPFVEKRKSFHIENVVGEFKTNRGKVIASRQKVVRRTE